MIRYKITLDELKKLIGEKWLDKAKRRTKKFKDQGFYEEKASIWSEIKPIYMTLQGDCKCAFCERKLESVERGKGEQAVEHFRPKGLVKHWELPVGDATPTIQLSKVADENKGYFLLAYDPFNYTASCNPCNSALKGNYFPIAGNYSLPGEEPLGLSNEKAYLIYPLGDFDDDPEELIHFAGVSPVPVEKSGFKFERAFITIKFFELDNRATRMNMFLERANIIIAMFPYLQKLDTASTPEKEKQRAQILIDSFTSANCAHTNCARSFRRLYERDAVKAEEVFDDAVKLVASKSSPK